MASQLARAGARKLYSFDVGGIFLADDFYLFSCLSPAFVKL